MSSFWNYFSDTVNNVIGPSINSRKERIESRKSINEKIIPMCCFCRNVLVPEKDPRYLECNHIACRKCLTLLEYRGVLSCPVLDCKFTTQLKENGIEDLRKYFNFINQEISSFQQENESVNLKNIDESYQYRNPSDLSQSFVDVPLDKLTEVTTQSYSIHSGISYPNEIKRNSVQLSEGFESTDKNNTIIIPNQKTKVNKKQMKLSSNQDDHDFIVLENESLTEKQIPKCYIPFTQKKEICKTLVKKWLSENWFLPSDLNENILINDPRPVYVPFYYFSVKSTTDYSVEIGTTKLEGTIEWKLYHGTIHNPYSDLMACASHSANIELVTSLMNRGFSLVPSDAPPYRSSISLAEEIFQIDISIDEAFSMIDKKFIENSERQAVLSEIKQLRPERTRNLIVCTPSIYREEGFPVLLPIYFGSFAYRGSSYEFVISGNKGIVEGKRPIGTGWLGKQLRDAVGTVKSVIHDQFGVQDVKKNEI